MTDWKGVGGTLRMWVAYTYAAELIATLERHGDTGLVVGICGEVVHAERAAPDAAVNLVWRGGPSRRVVRDGVGGRDDRSR